MSTPVLWFRWPTFPGDTSVGPDQPNPRPHQDFEIALDVWVSEPCKSLDRSTPPHFTVQETNEFIYNGGSIDCPVGCRAMTELPSP